jgi:hypothetical protein
MEDLLLLAASRERIHRLIRCGATGPEPHHAAVVLYKSMDFRNFVDFVSSGSVGLTQRGFCAETNAASSDNRRPAEAGPSRRRGRSAPERVRDARF